MRGKCLETENCSCAVIHFSLQHTVLLALSYLEDDDSCFYCGERGHNTDKCRHGMKIQCYNCGNVGHKYRNCRYYGMC